MNRYSDFSIKRDKDGKLNTSYNWWFDINDSLAFEIFDINNIYKPQYYITAEEPSGNVTKTLEKLFLHLHNIKTIINYGSGGGWFTRQLMDLGYDVTDIEGHNSGIERSIKDFNIPKEKIIQHDLRENLNLNQKFDLGICTELAEHIECPFSSILIQNIIRHTNLVYFTACEPRKQAHIHHCNEQPYKFWTNLFQFYKWYPYIRLCDPNITRGNGIIFYSGEEDKEAMNKIKN